MEHWHWQCADDSCAIVAQEFILDSLTGHNFSEQELLQEASQNGWYTPGGGTPLYQVGNLLEAHGFQVEHHSGATIEDIAQKLANGEKIIVGVDADEIWEQGRNYWKDELIGDLSGIPGQDANHAVQVIGIDRSDSQNPMVILNDPGTPNGMGLRVPVDEFVDAWADSEHFMVSTNGQQMDTTPTWTYPALHTFSFLGGYYNADGTYHYQSDNTDRDPETDAIVRYW